MSAPILFCPCCDEVLESQTRVVEREQLLPVKGEPINVTSKIRVCEKCESTIYDRDLDAVTLEKAFAVYRKRHHLMSPQEIRDLRARYDLSQRDLAELLGLGGATIARYESGNLPDAALNRLLLLMRDPWNMWEVLQENGHMISARARENACKRLTQVIAQESPGEAFRVIELGAAATTGMLNCGRPFNFVQNIDLPAELSGNREYSARTLAEMIRFFSFKLGETYKTKLNKLAFYADFEHYRRHDVSISGSPYLHFQYGPVPRDYEPLLIMLHRENLLISREEFVTTDEGEKTVEVWHADEYDEGLFTSQNIQVMDAVCQHFRTTSSREMVRISHEEEAYSATQPEEPISYEFARRLKVTFE